MKAKNLTLAIVVAATATFHGGTGFAHQHWGDGSPVSEQIKQVCCGDAEAHFLQPGSVHARADGWHIDGFAKAVPYGRELPSPDGNEWGFWSDHRYDGYKQVGGQSDMNCLFLNPRML
jgi:hypothetical protein